MVLLRPLLACLLASLAAGEQLVPPATWDQAAGNPQGAWGLYAIHPDKDGVWANYHPMVWADGRWTAPAHSRGGVPGARLADGVLRLTARGSWGGNDPEASLRRISALVFTVPADGVWSFTGEVAMKRGSGGGPNQVAVLAFPPDGGGPAPGDPSEEVQGGVPESRPPPPSKPPAKDAKPGAGVRQLASLRFRRPDPEPAHLDAAAFLAKGSRLALVSRLGDNNQVEWSVTGLTASRQGDLAPEDWKDGVRPVPPLPPAPDDQTPATVIEGEQQVFPADAGMHNVRLPPFNATGDGTTDDTRAIQAAINLGGVAYLPNGVYLVSDQLRYTAGARVPSRTTLHGQSIKGTILKLKDRTPDFGDPRQPLAVLWVSKFPPQAFHNHVRNLTIHTGVGNPGAIGLQFYASNQGSCEDVRIQSGDGAGPIGLDLGYDNDQGPCLVRGIRVEGFDVGVRCARQTTVTTLDQISVTGQKKAGFVNDMHVVAMRRFSSRNACPALVCTDPAAFTTIVEADLEGSGEAAIINEGGMYLREVKTRGYAQAVLNRNATGATPVAGPDLAEWASHPVLSAWPSPARSLHLPIVEAPWHPWGDPATTWQSVKAFSSEEVETGTVYKGKKVTYQNWAKAFQQACDAGKPTVYFPKGNYIVDGTVKVPPSVTRIIGMESAFDRDRGKLVLEVGEGTTPLIIERWDWNYSKVTVLHKTRRPLVIRNVVGSHYRPEPGAGDLWLDDICQGGLEFAKGQRVWARQLNPEYGVKPHIFNRGADLWILGLKTEGFSSVIVTSDGGRTELLGGMVYANQGRAHEPAYIVGDGCAFSASICEWILRSQHAEEVLVESRGGEFRTLRSDQVPKRGDRVDAKPLGGYATSNAIPLMTAYPEVKP